MVQTFSPPARHRLDPVGAYVWQLCDGSHTVDGIRREVAARFKGAEFPGQEIDEVIADLADRSLVRFTPARTPAPPLLRIAFAEPGDAEHHLGSFMSWVLTRRLNVLIVPMDEQTADAVVYSDPAALDGLADRSMVKIRVAWGNEVPDIDAADFTLGTVSIDNKHVGRYARLPPRAGPSTDRDWAAFDSKQTPGYKAARICDRLYYFLFDHAPAQAAPLKRPPKLTIGMATYDDYDGVYFTVQALCLNNPEVIDDIEIIVIDNNPNGVASGPLQGLANTSRYLRYVAFGDKSSTSVRDVVFQEARGDFVMCMDSHVLLAPGAVKRLIDYFESNPDCHDLLQGPLLDDNLEVTGTHWEPVWRNGMYGIWAVDSRGLDPASPPFDIPMQGLGVFACRKDAWLGFNPRFRGFGGEEWYIHEKFRRAGQRTLCLPFLRWAHRFNRTRKQAYDNRWGDRIYNYLTGFDELGLDTLSVVDYFAVDVSKRFAERARLAFERDRRNPFLFFGATYCINLDSAKNRWVEAGDRFKGLGIDRQVWRQSAVETPECHHLGCALSHWRIIERAAKSKLSSVLVLEDDVLFIQGAASMLEQCLEELDGVDWHYFYLGGHRWGQTFEKADGCHHIETLPVGTVTCTHAIVYHATVFDQLLSEIPDNENDMNDWIARWKGIDQFLMSKPNRFMACPVIASQPTLLDQEDDETRYKFY